MNRSASSPPAQPFFLKASCGERFALYHAPSSEAAYRGAFIYVHPFCEEMNKSRRMAALQARAFASMGFGVLQVDLFGCGDSSGEFRDARWDIWKEDLAVAHHWLRHRAPEAGAINLWGLRLGALLALDFAKDLKSNIDRIVLWEPVINGEIFLTQFLRLRMASDMIAAEQEKAMGTRGMRDRLAAGESIEVGGYELAPALAAAVDRLRLENLGTTTCAVDWFHIVSRQGLTMTPAATRVADDWTANGVELRMHVVPCEPFWTTAEIAECPCLLSATSGILTPHTSSVVELLYPS